MEKILSAEGAESVVENDHFIELAEAHLALVGGGIGDTQPI
jgi:hypothetical protein